MSGCMVFAETTQSSKEADSFRPLLGLDHPVSKIPAATPPREAPKLPRCTAQPAQLRPHIISSQLVVLCVSVCPAVLPCLQTAALGGDPPIESPYGVQIRSCYRPEARRHGRLPSLLGWTETRVTPCACSVLRCTVRLAVVHDLHMHRCSTQYDRLGERCV
jgi:hypothetical protein